MTHAVAIVPAYNRADTVGGTVTALRAITEVLDVIVIDDGSTDSTASVAAAAGARVVELARNRGKGAALAAGVAASGAPEVYLLVDADLGDSATLAATLVEPVAQGETDMAIAVLGKPNRPSGFGLVKAFAAQVARGETGLTLAEPLSGQRAVRGSLLRSADVAEGFGSELGLTLDAAARGATISELEVDFVHQPSGRDVRGFAHRARIGRDVWRAAAARVGWSKATLYLAASLLNRMRSLRLFSPSNAVKRLKSIRPKSIRLGPIRLESTRLPRIGWRRSSREP